MLMDGSVATRRVQVPPPRDALFYKVASERDARWLPWDGPYWTVADVTRKLLDTRLWSSKLDYQLIFYIERTGEIVRNAHEMHPRGLVPRIKRLPIEMRQPLTFSVNTSTMA